MLLGDDETPLPSWFVAIRKYFAGSSALPGPTRKSYDVWSPEYGDGSRIALIFAAFKLPRVVYASFAPGNTWPDSNLKSPRSYIFNSTGSAALARPGASMASMQRSLFKGRIRKKCEDGPIADTSRPTPP